MLDPNLNIWALLLYAYVLYGCGYVLGLALDADRDNEPGLVEACFAFCFCILVWPFIKGTNDGAK